MNTVKTGMLSAAPAALAGDLLGGQGSMTRTWADPRRRGSRG